LQHDQAFKGAKHGRYFVNSCFEAACTSWHSRVPVFFGVTKEFFRAELNSLELNSPEIKPNTFEEIRVGTQGDCLLSAVCPISVSNGWPLTNQCSTIITHVRMSQQYIMMFCTRPIRSSFPCNYTVYFGEKTPPRPPWW